ncbi:MAG: hypothetical protein JJ957_08410 [Pseudomonadales bacterium]|nr:hypothetical protein [Pseudomonadales bacterium]MBO6596486.1 hypothetical protein [Pseudomonadales bacterium]MBO6822966.1 hypothetical protein [Pseudomonadales bacterium]
MSADNNNPDATTWTQDIARLFTAQDVKCMDGLSWGGGKKVRLGNYESVKTHAEDIYDSIVNKRMPPGKPWPESQIKLFRSWIDGGCLIGSREGWGVSERPARHDDCWFISADVGWAVNQDGEIMHTFNGGVTWQSQFLTHDKVMLRSISFADSDNGWVGLLARLKSNDQEAEASVPLMYQTKNGGTDWHPVENYPEGGPKGICGLFAVSESVVYGAGTNYVGHPARVIKTIDGGQNWKVIEMGEYADNLIDVHFFDERRGFVLGGFASSGSGDDAEVEPVVLYTEDGGENWKNTVTPDCARKGEWAWKIFFLSDKLGFVAMESYDYAGILKTLDGGMTWERIEVEGNANLQSVGFVTEQLGWVGGWGEGPLFLGETSETRDGGRSWRRIDGAGRSVNRFRIVRDEVNAELKLFASGNGIQTYIHSLDKATPGSGECEWDNRSRSFRVMVNSPATRLALNVWNRSGLHLCEVEESGPVESGLREIFWDCKDDHGQELAPDLYQYRLEIDECNTSGNFSVS